MKKEQGFYIIFITLIFYLLTQTSYDAAMGEIATFKSFSSYASLICNTLIYFSIVFIIYGISNNIFLSNWILTIFHIVITFISLLKSFYTLSPLYLSDLNFLGNGFLEIIDVLNFDTCLSVAWIVVKKFSLYMFILILLTQLKKQINTNINKKTRIVFISSCSALLIVLFNPIIFRNIAGLDHPHYNYSIQYSEHGFFTGIYAHELSSKISEPEDYDEKNVQYILENYKSSNESVNTWGQPNIIVVLSEAFFEFEKIDSVKTDFDLYKYVNYLEKNSTVFNPISGIYGGRTANTEFEYNTLSSLRYFSDAIIPYNQFYNNTTEGYVSVAEIFNNNNYETIIYSPYDNGYMFKVKTVYPKLGFKNCYYYNEIKQRIKNEILQKGNFIADENVINLVIEDIENNEQPIYSFVKTVQNHAPYTNYDYSVDGINYKDIVFYNTEKEIYDESELTLFSSYAIGMYDNTKSLCKLYDYIQTIDEPTIVIVFGDHLPSLLDMYSDVLEKSNLFNNEDELKNLYNRYSTQGFIFSNYDIDTSDLPNDISFDILSTYVLKHLDIDKGEYSSYIDYLYDSMKNLPAANRFISINNSICRIDELENESKEFYDTREQLQYYYFNNTNY